MLYLFSPPVFSTYSTSHCLSAQPFLACVASSDKHASTFIYGAKLLSFFPDLRIWSTIHIPEVLSTRLSSQKILCVGRNKRNNVPPAPSLTSHICCLSSQSDDVGNDKAATSLSSGKHARGGIN
ncbi:hypothetical protein BJ165DRAFT_1510227 [Panaeolus papilionaceus]|nr:hypothetical protein BJ165DRAFT_1510227 [Panaeolus papilionaceus]